MTNHLTMGVQPLKEEYEEVMGISLPLFETKGK
jgi:hypothetical protein